MDYTMPYGSLYDRADAAVDEATGFLDTTSTAYLQRIATTRDAPGTKYPEIVQARVTRPAGYTAPWSWNRQEPRVSVPLVRDQTTGETPADWYNIQVVVATFNDPALEPFNKYLRLRAFENAMDQNDHHYVNWFEYNHLPVLVPYTYSTQSASECAITTAGLFLSQYMTVSTQEMEELVVHGFKGNEGGRDEGGRDEGDRDEGDGNEDNDGVEINDTEIEMLVPDPVEFQSQLQVTLYVLAESRSEAKTADLFKADRRFIKEAYPSPPSRTVPLALFNAADTASEKTTGFLDTTSVAYRRRLATTGDAPGTKYPEVTQARVTRPAGYTAPWSKNRRGPRVPVPLVRDQTTGETPADWYSIQVLVATFNDPALEPFNKYLRLRAFEHALEQNDTLYVDWFEHNHLPVLVPRTYSCRFPPERPITTNNSSLYQYWTVSVQDMEELIAYVHGYRGDQDDGDKDNEDDDENNVEVGMLIADLVEFGSNSDALHEVDE
ncbi:hypothetical protein SEUCBS139899_010656 [Sporothrix eucalyptigena]